MRIATIIIDNRAERSRRFPASDDLRAVRNSLRRRRFESFCCRSFFSLLRPNTKELRDTDSVGGGDGGGDQDDGGRLQ